MSGSDTLQLKIIICVQIFEVHNFCGFEDDLLSAKFSSSKFKFRHEMKSVPGTITVSG